MLSQDAMRRWGGSASLAMMLLMTAACGHVGAGQGSESTPPAEDGGDSGDDGGSDGGDDSGGDGGTTPTGPNTALDDLQVSQTFQTASTVGSARYAPGSGDTPVLVTASVSIAYDAATKGYTLTAGAPGASSAAVAAADESISQTFLPADLVRNETTSQIALYAKLDGSNASTLTLTRPGTSGRFTYQYVGGGIWHYVAPSAADSGLLDDVTSTFIYGFPTANSAVPRTGRAEYTVDLLGRETVTGGLWYDIQGQGRAQVDFATGAVVTHGSLRGAINGSTTFSSEARLSSSANSFTGTFRFDDDGLFSGALSGALYGPAGQEIGAAFSAETDDNRTALGVILGRRTTVPQANPSIVSPQFNQFFPNDAAEVTGEITGAGPTGTASAAPLIVNYDAGQGKYTLIADDRSQFFSTNIVAEGDNLDTLTLVPRGAFQYARGGEWRRLTPTDGGTAYAIADFTFGVETPSTAMPRTGTAGYAAAISGSMIDPAYDNLLSFSGDGTVTADFGAGTLSVGVRASYDSEAATGTVLDVARGAFEATGTIGSDSQRFSGNATLSGIAAYAGSFNGRFYGPDAGELGLSFNLASAAGGAASGLVLGRRDPALTDPLTTLAGVSGITTFDNSRYVLLGTGLPVFASNAQLVYDPATSTYTFHTSGDSGAIITSATFGPGQIDSANSVDPFTAYLYDSGADVTADAKVLTGTIRGLTLTYTSFADINVHVPTGAIKDTHYYYPFGIDTPSAQLPTVGTASYTGIVYGDGHATGTGGSTFNYTLFGDSSLIVDFTNSTFAQSITITNDTQGLSAHKPVGTYAGTGTLNSSGVMTGTFSGGAVTGDWRGSFFGPNAAEFGAAFVINNVVSNPGQTNDGDTMRLNGVTIGKRATP